YGGEVQAGSPLAAVAPTPRQTPQMTPVSWAHAPSNVTPVLPSSSSGRSGSWSGLAPSESLQSPQDAQPPQPDKRPRPWLPYIMIGAALVLLLVLGTSGVLFYLSTLPTPTKTLDAFCTALQNRDYQTAYKHLSGQFKSKVSPSMFQGFFVTVSSCTHGSP